MHNKILICLICILVLNSVQPECSKAEELSNSAQEYIKDDEINIDKKIKKMDLKRTDNIVETQASWYGKQFHGRKTAANEIFDANGLSAAHRTLPIGTHVLVTNKANGKQVIVRVNDRGPFIKGRGIDLSESAALILDYLRAGVANVTYEVLEEKGE